MQYKDSNGAVTHFLTSKSDRSMYYLYEVTGDSYKKLGKAKRPPDLEEKYLHRS